FDENLKNRGIKIITPEALNQFKMGVIINNLVNNQQTRKDREDFLKIIKSTNTKNVILACTDLQILEPKIQGIQIFDTMDILAKAAIKRVLE
ncbi:MAG TPA: hypothetical protein VMR41_00965, partial [Patescibacteria group bacterium]|nr:hypothetical protein [Patescibacteria group bacterium]